MAIFNSLFPWQFFQLKIEAADPVGFIQLWWFYILHIFAVWMILKTANPFATPVNTDNISYKATINSLL